MTSPGDRTRVLRFAVSTALLGAGAAALVGCQKPRVNTGPTDPPPSTTPIDGAPVADTAAPDTTAEPTNESSADSAGDTSADTGPIEPPAPEHVNTGPQADPKPPVKPPTPTKPPTVMVNPGPAPTPK